MTFDPNKPYTRRDGGEAVIEFVRKDGMLGVRHWPDSKKEEFKIHNRSGQTHIITDYEHDLINVPEDMYVNVYTNNISKWIGQFFVSPESAAIEFNRVDIARKLIGTYKLVKVGE